MSAALLALLLAAPAADTRPTVALHPWVISGVDSKRERAELMTSFSATLTGMSEVQTVPPEKVEAVLNKMPQMECRGDAQERCLADLASQSGALYTLKIELERALQPGEWRLAGEVVRSDGTVSRNPPIVTFKEVKGTRFPVSAKAALETLLQRLDLGSLAPTLPPKVVQLTPEPRPEAPAPVPPPPPPPMPALEERPAGGTSGLRVASFVSGGLGVAGLATGAVCAVLAQSDASTLKGSLVQVNGKAVGIPESSRALAGRIDTESTVATASLAAGGVLLAAGVTMFLLSGSEAPAVSLAPVPGGAFAVLGGRF